MQALGFAILFRQRSVGTMTFDTFITAHAEWKLRLRLLLESKQSAGLRPEELEAHDRCELGVWLRGDGCRFSGDPVFPSLEGAHRNFHHSAADVVRLALSGGRLEAETLLSGEYAKHSAALISALRELRTRADTSPHARQWPGLRINSRS